MLQPSGPALHAAIDARLDQLTRDAEVHRAARAGVASPAPAARSASTTPSLLRLALRFLP